MDANIPLIADPNLAPSPQKTPRLSTREVLRIASPFPILWVLMGLVDPGVFTPWVTNRPLGSLTKMTLSFVPLGFTLFYAIGMYAASKSRKPIGWAAVIGRSVFAFLVANILTPIP